MKQTHDGTDSRSADEHLPADFDAQDGCPNDDDDYQEEHQ